MMINDVYGRTSTWMMMRMMMMMMMINDLYVDLPAEDPEAHPDILGHLRVCLYGTRDAAFNWHHTLVDHLVCCGFVRGVGHTSVFHHIEKHIWKLVHGDDYCSVGPSDSLD